MKVTVLENGLYNLEDLESGTIVKCVANCDECYFDFGFDEKHYTLEQEGFYAIVIRDVNEKLIGIFDLEDERLYDDIDNFIVVGIYKINKLEIDIAR